MFFLTKLMLACHFLSYHANPGVCLLTCIFDTEMVLGQGLEPRGIQVGCSLSKNGFRTFKVFILDIPSLVKLKSSKECE
jgi:hypothetical protein